MNKYDYQHPSDQIVEMMNGIYRFGMTTTSGGNLSILDSNGDMWITPSGIDKGTLTRNDIMCVKANGKIIGPHKPSCEYPFHRAIYKIRPEAKAIIHAHPPMLISFSLAHQIPNTNVLATTKAVCGNIGYAKYAIPGSELLGSYIAEEFARGNDLVLMENHGAVTCGTSLLEAFKRFETLDFTARIINKASHLGKPYYLDDKDVKFALMDRNKEFKKVAPEIPSSEERELRKRMAELVQRSYKQMLFTSTEGTYAMRVDKDSFLITPSNVDRAYLDPEDIILVKGNTYSSFKDHKLSRAAWFAQAIYAKQPKINSLIISHPVNIMAYGVSRTPFDTRLIPESYIVLRELPVFEFGTHYKDVNKIAETISPRLPALMVQNEFLLTAGSTLIEAFDRMEVTEYSAKAAINAKVLGGLYAINQKQVDDIVDAFKLIP